MMPRITGILYSGTELSLSDILPVVTIGIDIGNEYEEEPANPPAPQLYPTHTCVHEVLLYGRLFLLYAQITQLRSQLPQPQSQPLRQPHKEQPLRSRSLR